MPPVLAAVLLLFAGPRLSFAWGCRGHQIVAYIAWSHLRPDVAARVERILATSVPGGGTGHCRAPGAPAMVQVAAWADSVRDPAKKPLHYVDLPVEGSQPPNFRRACRAGCVTTAIADYRRQLRRTTLIGAAPSAAAPRVPLTRGLGQGPHSPQPSPREAPASRAIALRYLIHLVGDISQPLHDSDEDDRGGNCVRTRLPGRSRRLTSLHADWDSVFLARLEGNQPVAIFARSLDRKWGKQVSVRTLDPEVWAMQGYRVAVQSIYEPLHIRPGCRRRAIALKARYVQSLTPVLEQQLVRGGLRLAALLNASFR